MRGAALLACWAAVLLVSSQTAAAQTPALQCKNTIFQCEACALNRAKTWQCSKCDRFSTLDLTSGYTNQTTRRFVKRPFCKGYCMHQYQLGNILENGQDPCVRCTGNTGCSSCLRGSYPSPDAFGMLKFNLPSLPTKCGSCGFCESGRCGATGCTKCEADATRINVAGPLPAKDPQVCIRDLCDDNGDPEFVFNMPINKRLWSYAPHCKQVGRVRSCSRIKGCTACAPGLYLAKQPLVPSAALCQHCEGCPAGNCRVQGCTACPIPGLTRRVQLPGVVNPWGKPVFACRPAATPKAFAGRGAAGLADTALWPVSEFTGCGPDVGEYMVVWSNSDTNSEFSIASWFDQEQQAITFPSKGMLKLSFALANKRVTIQLEYSHSKTRKLVKRSMMHPLPLTQDRVCITFANYIEMRESELNQTAQIKITNKSNKKVLLRFTGGDPSLLPRVDIRTELPFKGGGVTVLGRTGAALAGPSLGARGIKWQNTEQVVFLPSESEWDAFAKVPAGK